MKVYIAGPITGNEDYKSQFKFRQICLESEGHIVLNPAELPVGLEHAEYMHICFSMIDIADAVSFLDNWKDSRGARMEYNYAIDKGKLILDIASSNKDKIKTLIQQALWEMYNGTGIEEYRLLYEDWYNNYEKISIKGLSS